MVTVNGPGDANAVDAESTNTRPKAHAKKNRFILLSSMEGQIFRGGTRTRELPEILTKATKDAKLENRACDRNRHRHRVPEPRASNRLLTGTIMLTAPVYG